MILEEASIRGVIRYGRAEEPLGWERTGKALNLTFIEGITSTILVDFCQIAGIQLGLEDFYGQINTFAGSGIGQDVKHGIRPCGPVY